MQTLKMGVVAEALAPDAREAAEAARLAGFAGVQFQAFSPQLNLTELSQTGRREFRRILTSHNQQLIGLRVDVGPKGFGPGADVDRLLSQFVRVMDAAKSLAAPLVCVEAGPLPEPAIPAQSQASSITAEQAGLIIIPEMPAPAPPAREPARVEPDHAAIDHVDQALMELGSCADRLGVTLAFRSELSSLAALERALVASACPWFGVDLDPVALLRDAWKSDEVFSRLGPLIRHVNARDAVLGSSRRTRPAVIGRGSVDWSQMLSSLDSAGFSGWLTLDSTELPDRAGAAAAGLRHLTSASP